MYDDRSKDKLTDSIFQESDFRATAQNKNKNVTCMIATSRKQDLDWLGSRCESFTHSLPRAKTLIKATHPNLKILFNFRKSHKSTMAFQVIVFKPRSEEVVVTIRKV